MFKSGSKLYGMLKLKCPRCQEGDLFLSKNPYDFKELGKMPDACPHCNQNFSPEPGFYFGATYVSYAITVMMMLTGSLVNYLFLDFPLDRVLMVLIAVFVLITPIVFRFSRSAWLGFFVKYDPEAGPEKLAKTPGRASGK